MFTQQDLDNFDKRGISLMTVEKQINNFKEGFPALGISRAAAIQDGIIRLDEDQIKQLCELYTEYSEQKSIGKFVPASGAATRMFKDLYVFVEKFPSSGLSFEEFVEKNKIQSVASLMAKIRQTAFFEELKDAFIQKEQDIEKALEEKDYHSIVSMILLPQGLAYGSLPKGLLTFHRYEDSARKAAHEQLVEGVLYAIGKGREVRVHFTVSPEHEALFDALVRSVRQDIEREHHISLNVTFSVQQKSTDTIAVDMDNNPFRDADSNIVFRPAGHGALIQNLNLLADDIIFIKNIDNIVPDHLKSPTVDYKKALAGKLIELQVSIHKFLEAFEFSPSDQLLEQAEHFIEDSLYFKLHKSHYTHSMSERKAYVVGVLNRPIRVCGMVKNEGEPGGGPFWVENTDGSLSLQIVESAQIDLNDPRKAAIFKSSSHFNPVDLVCAVKDYKGRKFDLPQYVDHKTGFISQKSMAGRDLKALELPGLWNGAMSNWITLFVEVPIETFNPVKTVNDLLRPSHQQK